MYTIGELSYSINVGFDFFIYNECRNFYKTIKTY